VPLLPSGNKDFNSTLKDASLKENAALALETFNPYISPKPNYFPLIAATGVLFTEANYIPQPYLYNHSSYVKELIFCR